MQIEDTGLEGVKLITPKRFGDHRGFFAETWNAKAFADAGISLDFVQDNHSLSEKIGTVRGLHFQAPPHAQAKLVRCGKGALFDVAVDIRKGSPTFGHWVGYELSYDNGKQLLVPAGFAHGFMTLQPATEIVYKCSNVYAPAAEGALRWNDAAISIAWPLASIAPVISDKDSDAPGLARFDSPFTMENTL